MVKQWHSFALWLLIHPTRLNANSSLYQIQMIWLTPKGCMPSHISICHSLLLMGTFVILSWVGMLQVAHFFTLSLARKSALGGENCCLDEEQLINQRIAWVTYPCLEFDRHTKIALLPWYSPASQIICQSPGNASSCELTGDSRHWVSTF